MGEERLCIKCPVHRWFPVANLTLYRSAIIYESHMPGKSSLSIWLSGIFKLIHYFPPSFIIIMKWHIPQSISKCKCSTPRHFTCWTSARFAVVTSVLIVRISAALPSRPNSHLRCVSFCVVCWPTLYSSTAIGLFDPINFVILISRLFFSTFKKKQCNFSHFLEYYFIYI